MRMLVFFSPWIASKRCEALATMFLVPGLDVDGLVFRICFVLSWWILVFAFSWFFLVLLYYDFFLYSNSRSEALLQ
jgi:hypothetical protein